jgi:hypothetical protein
MSRLIAVIIIIMLLSGGLAAATYASYNGYGLVAAGNPSARTGSLGGPIILGGGPGSGK